MRCDGGGAMAEFLPLCDVLFNVISLAGYFCDVVFDVVMAYALLERGHSGAAAAAASIVLASLVVSQVLSLRWHLHVWAARGGAGRAAPWLPVALHCLQLGVLWRYAKLFVPNDLRHVKHQVRDLCMLRLVHAFCSAAPMLLLQLHVLLSAPPELPDEPRLEPAANKSFAQLNVISASLSLFSVCWALASFSKNVRLRHVHRLVLTWLGVIFQFLWRLGTISARMCALTVYALSYEYYIFLVIGLHWFSMFLWLMSPKSIFHGERLGAARRAYLSALVAVVHVFAYINLQDRHPRQKMITFYSVMVIENCILVLACWGGAGVAGVAGGAGGVLPLVFILGATTAGLAFMMLYYRFFHVRRLGYMLREHQQGTNSTNASSQNKNGKQMPSDAAAIPGVFNCRFSNPVAANARKKKKPSSFVPPPAAPAPPAPAAPAAAFWRRPLPTTHNHHGGSSENEGSSVGSRVNIQQKLQEKKQKQLAELRVIEEEIKQGKLAKTTPVAVEEIYSSLQRQPIPRAKTHADPPSWPALDITHPYQNYPVLPHTCNIYPTYTEIKQTYNFPNGTENGTANELNEQLNARRIPNRGVYSQDPGRTFYESPANGRAEVNRTPLRTYLVGETRSYETNGCGSPKNALNNSPRAYAGDVSSANNSYERPSLDKSRIPIQNTPIYEDRQNLGEYSGYCENNNQNMYNKGEYVAAIQTALSNAQGVDIRTYSDANNPVYGQNGGNAGYGQNGGNPGYGQNGDRLFPYTGVAKSKLEVMRKMQRCRTPEILLAPHYLEGCNRQVCCHWGAPQPYNGRKKEDGVGASSGEESSPEGVPRDTPRPPSDIDSQISLPRSYTLPREFRYWRRRPRLRDARLPSNNSSDGDVDSGDDNSDGRSDSSSSQRQNHREPRPARRLCIKPETKL
ncbi:hypothetical protein JYU34_015240 [Plutella xylostella]|uniref:XK-related protein n=1 Tax=Plutella xylostella TaxID=51655 RepID=A0ABQ7Q6N2_PLUXY|nr:hypothetical protein JYU34_015240 [Plutella xylostella]